MQFEYRFLIAALRTFSRFSILFFLFIFPIHFNFYFIIKFMAQTRITVCQLLHTLNVGGAEILATRLAQRLSGPRWRFVFFCLDAPGVRVTEMREAGFPVEVLRRRPGCDWGCMRNIAHLWKNYNVNFVQAHQYTPFFYALGARGLFRSAPPILFTEHGRFFPDLPNWKHKIYNHLLMSAKDRIVTVGGSVRDAIVQNEGIPAERVQVIYNGVNSEQFTQNRLSQTEKNDLRASLGLTDEYVILQVARLDSIKDHPTAIRAMKRLISLPAPQPPRNENSGSGFRVAPTSNAEDSTISSFSSIFSGDSALLTSLASGSSILKFPAAEDNSKIARISKSRSRRPVLLLVGGGPDLENVRNEIVKYRLEKRVRMLGERTDVEKLLQIADVLLLTSKSEGIPLTILEAFASCVPVVATKVGGIPEIITSGENGLLAPAGDDIRIAGNLHKILTKPEYAAALAENARKRFEEGFTEDQMVYEYERLYEEIVNE